MSANKPDFDPGQTRPDTQKRSAGVEPSDSRDQWPSESQNPTVPTVDLSGYRMLRVLAEMFYDAQENRKRIANRAGRYAQAEGTPTKHTMPDWLAFEVDNAAREEKRVGKLLVAHYHDVAPRGVILWQESTPGVGAHLTARLLGHLGHPRIAVPYHWEGTGTKRALVADDPYLRSVGQLWAYCGHGDPALRGRSKVAEENFAAGSPMLKMLVWNMASCAMKHKNPDPTIEPSLPSAQASGRDPLAATQCGADTHLRRGGGDLLDPGQADCDTQVKAAGVDPSETADLARNDHHLPPVDGLGSSCTATIVNAVPISDTWPYRVVYDQRRLETAERLHGQPCVRCGPSGKPAQPGTPWSKNHQLADALRIVGKTILRDIWEAS